MNVWHHLMSNRQSLIKWFTIILVLQGDDSKWRWVCGAAFARTVQNSGFSSQIFGKTTSEIFQSFLKLSKLPRVWTHALFYQLCPKNLLAISTPNTKADDISNWNIHRSTGWSWKLRPLNGTSTWSKIANHASRTLQYLSVLTLSNV